MSDRLTTRPQAEAPITIRDMVRMSTRLSGRERAGVVHRMMSGLRETRTDGLQQREILSPPGREVMVPPGRGLIGYGCRDEACAATAGVNAKAKGPGYVIGWLPGRPRRLGCPGCGGLDREVPPDRIYHRAAA